MRRDSLAHYTQEYDRAAKIHSALWREIRPKPAPPVRLTPDSVPPDPAPSNPATTLAFRQPDTGAPVSDPLLKTSASQSPAPLGAFAQPLSNRLDSNRTEPAGGETKRAQGVQVASARDGASIFSLLESLWGQSTGNEGDPAESANNEDERARRRRQVAAINKARAYRDALWRRDQLRTSISKIEARNDPDEIAKAQGLRDALEQIQTEVDANSPADDFERDLFEKSERIDSLMTAADMLLGRRGGPGRSASVGIGARGGGAKPTSGAKPMGAANTTPSPIENANFAQRTYSPMFSKGGKFSNRRVRDVAADLKSGKMTVEDVPIDYIVRDGHVLILNTRSAHALIRAGIPISQRKINDVSGDPNAQKRLNRQLKRSGLGNKGIPSAKEKRNK